MSALFKKIIRLTTLHRPEAFLLVYILISPVLIFCVSQATDIVVRHLEIERVSAIEQNFKQESRHNLESTQAALHEQVIERYIKNGAIEGVFGGRVLDDTYASSFKRNYLKSGEEIAFYSKQTGLSGESFADDEIRRLVGVYFNIDSDWVQQGHSELGGRLLRIGNDRYHVGNGVLAGLDRNVDGMLVFLPAYTMMPYVVVGGTGIVVLLALLFHVRRKHRENKIYLIAVPTMALVLMLGSFLIYEHIAHQHDYDLSEPPYAIYNSTIALSPESDMLQKTSESRLAIEITTGGESINAAEAHLSFDPSLMRVEDIVMTHSFCGPDFVLEKDIDNEKGEVSVACGVPGGFTGDKTILAELLVQPLRTGKATVRFLPETQVLAQDGLGTNVLRSMTDGTYQIIDVSVQARGDAKVVVFSYTHPNEARWYNKRTIHLDWLKSRATSDFVYSLDQVAQTIPNGDTSTTSASIDLSVHKDGIYYFHIASRKDGHIGPISHYKFMIDATPPETPIIKSSATEISAGEAIRFEFSGNDRMSGMQKNFYVQFDGGVWLPTLPQLYLPFLESGNHTVGLRVFDNAGNFADANIKITVQ